MSAAPDPSSALLSTYPRARPPLTPAHHRIFAAEYKRNREGRGAVVSAAARLERWMHRRVAALRDAPGPVLELGAGTLNHLPYEPDARDYDAVEPLGWLVASSPHRDRVRSIYPSVSAAPDGARYGRVISIATLEHMTDLPCEVARAVLRMRADGVFQAGIPSEGGLAWWMAWRLVTGTAFYVRNRLDYGVVMRHEHVNTAADVRRVVRHFFGDVRLRRFPTPLHHASFYTYIEARRPDRAKAAALLDAAARRDPA